ncbi:MAG TPA: hypothetical protein VMU54_15980 [Planctomycetota bacterium]|nr:hypothetical protein [Planctomycetota bacterium]
MKNPASRARLAERAKELYSSSRKAATEELDRANSFIQENPVKSALLGVGLGFLLASLWRSRD